MSVAAVVVAAGQGSRFGGPKQFSRLHDTTVAARSVANAREVADVVVLVVPAGYHGDGEGADVVVVGGATRADSVRAGLARCGDAEVVVVHDAARPLASPKLFRAVVDAVLDGAAAAVPGVGLADTLKSVATTDRGKVVTSTLDREGLVLIQTPQAFRFEVLQRAHATSNDASDDAGLVEALGVDVVVIDGEPANVKLTHASDLVLLSALGASLT